MNNSFNIDLYEDFSQEKPNQEPLREREAKLLRVIEALAAVSQSNEWSTLKSELFDDVLKSIENRLRVESEKTEVNLPEIYRLQGEKKWARNYADLQTLIEQYRLEITHIRMQLSPPGPTG